MRSVEMREIAVVSGHSTETYVLEICEDEECDEVTIKIISPLLLDRTAENFFEALLKIRQELEKDDKLLYCYGSARGFYPSPFILSSGNGRLTYRLELGKQAISNDLVDIFDSEPGLNIATVDEQAQWYRVWLNSLRH